MTVPVAPEPVAPDAPPAREPAVETRLKAVIREGKREAPKDGHDPEENEIPARWPETTAITEALEKALGSIDGVDASKVTIAWHAYGIAGEQGLTVSFSANWVLPRPEVEPLLLLPEDLEPEE